MGAMLAAFAAEPVIERTFFNDSALVAAGLCPRLSVHDDHAHVEIHSPVRRGGTRSPLPLVEADAGERT